MDPSPIPGKQRSLRDLLVAEIRSGRYPPATRLPSEWDLVKRCGVCRSTVRKALDGLVSEGLVSRRRGQATWVHPEAVHRLSGSALPSRSIAVVLPAGQADNLIFAGILAAFAGHLPDHLRLAVHFHDFVKPALYADAAAVVVDGGLGAQAIAELRERVQHLAVINRMVRGLPCACTDNRAGGALMARHAIERGHRRIGVLHFGEKDTEEEFILRLRGIRSACAAAGVELNEVALRLHQQYAFTPRQALDHLLRIAPETTVILCVTDHLAFSVHEALSGLGIAVPKRMALIGFDDLPISAVLATPLTTVKQPVDEIGEALATAVMAMIDGRPPGIGHPIRPQLVPRASCPPLAS